MTTPQDRADMAAYLESQGVHCAQPAFLDALITLFRTMEGGKDTDVMVQD
ncbi:MAG: hypothetical protein L0K89_02635 [Bifidobacterium crudilactis]|nr:hypothetical protein [Bifidobacterium crudilactis]